MKRFFKIFLLVLTMSIIGKSQVLAQPENGVVFYRIDNIARILVDSNKVYDSGFIEKGAVIEIEVDLNPFLKNGINNVEIQLINECDNCGLDVWEIIFEIYENGESIDYWYASSAEEELGIGLVSTKTYELDIN